MIEQDAVRRMQPIGMPVIDRHPVCVQLGGRVRAPRAKFGAFILRHGGCVAVELRRRGLVEPARRQSKQSYRFEQSQGAQPVGVGRVFRRLETDLDVRLCGEIVDFIRLHGLDDSDQIGGVGHIAEVKDEPRIGLVRVLIDVVDPAGVERGRTALDPVHLVAFRQEQVRKISPVLARNACDKRDLPRSCGQRGQGVGSPI